MSVDLKDIQRAARRLQDVAVRTPILNNAALDARVGLRVFIKPENLQHIGAFKFRGAYNRLVQLDSRQRAQGVVAFSSGNHAQGVAYAAQLLGMQATIVMPSDAPEIKKEGTAALGASIRFYDRHTESREEIAADIAASSGATLVPAFDDVDVIAGQGTCGLELMEQLEELQQWPDCVLSPCGGGGLLSGVSTAVKGIRSSARVYGVEPEHYDDHALSRQAGERIRIKPEAGTSCDALMATMPGEITWGINSRIVDDFLVVTEAEIAHAVSFAWRYLKLVIEPGGVVALAALLAGKLPKSKVSTAAIILSGGNIDRHTLCACLEKYPSP